MLDPLSALIYTALGLGFTGAHLIDRRAERQTARYRTRRASCLRLFIDGALRLVWACPDCAPTFHLSESRATYTPQPSAVCGYCLRLSDDVLTMRETLNTQDSKGDR